MLSIMHDTSVIVRDSGGGLTGRGAYYQRGARGILSARDPLIPHLPNGITLNSERFKNIKISFCIPCIEKFLVYLQKKEIFINNFN
jgi:hypothetical protein